ncbi:phosphate ABC transporter substrate-binding/OmpA family protein [Pseudogemmobacter sp. W21_MBD1_M6]|uniref:phosphate ABC transporter substrate-binding/OmpA family protein n=1 Tax=Pseudogemmobacter sp. W21_MBD1_M6 TaxID=3240271 RepID=UPI003F970E8B
MAIFRAAGFAVLFLSAFACPAISQDVTLTSRDGSLSINGTLLGYDGEFYRVDSVYGELTLDGSGVVCAGPGCPNLQAFVAELTLSGAASMGEVLLPALIEAFAVTEGLLVRRVVQDDIRFRYILRDAASGHDVARFGFRLTNTDEGFADLLANEADIAMALREPNPVELALALDAGLGDLRAAARGRIVALDGLVPVVAAGNPVRSMAMVDLGRIFSGEVSNWADLGAMDAPIMLHLPVETSGTAQDFDARVMRAAGLASSEGVIRHMTQSDLADAVAADPFAIGISTYSETGNTRILALRGSCGFPAAASYASLKSEDYPLTAPLFLYTPARRQPQIVRAFFEYLRSPAAQLVIRRAGFVDEGPLDIPVSAQGERLANAIEGAGAEVSLDDLKRMVDTLRSAKRLTTTFRFEGGATDLDAQSRSNVLLLAQALETGIYDERELIFVGFSDGLGDAAANLGIARKRAEAVREAVRIAAATADPARLTLTAEAFGEAMPMACDDTDWGRQINRRVEIWVR